MKVSDTFLGFVNIEFGYIEEEISSASLAEFCSESVRLDEAFEVSLIGHFSKINCAEIFQNGLYVFHQTSHRVLFLKESQEEVDFASFGQFS